MGACCSGEKPPAAKANNRSSNEAARKRPVKYDASPSPTSGSGKKAGAGGAAALSPKQLAVDRAGSGSSGLDSSTKALENSTRARRRKNSFGELEVRKRVNVVLRGEQKIGVQWAGHGACVIATHVKAGLPGYLAGMQPGWQVLSICGFPIQGQDSLLEAITHMKKEGGGLFVMTPTFTLPEVSMHNKRGNCWVVVNSQVYDVSKYSHKHPGGETILLQHAGSDVTEVFEASHPESARFILQGFQIGNVRPDFLLGAAAPPPSSTASSPKESEAAPSPQASPEG
eukprot:TRINITY_DN27589_c0_g1_i1.p1 TRINITY_DN27589_c0_g1~~TRINITY_DN27589_c0_g1_i1.p1  ORF type:complete len:321 (+),score=65.83 TRINITY_DN27589_c0_g1_i1:112-963(+)